MTKEVTCNHCGAKVGRLDKKCSKCGRMILRKEIMKSRDYSGVRMQQGRVSTDDDWTESPRIASVRKETARVKCESCGAINLRNRKECRNCGTKL
ncbi:MAG: hypothetical protein ACW98Y_10920 [Candidatus Thorarchaeota archaeon]